MKLNLLTILWLSFALAGCAAKKSAVTSLKRESVPSLTAPEVRRIWVPEKIDGTRFVDGHYEYIIDKPSVWSR